MCDDGGGGGGGGGVGEEIRMSDEHMAMIEEIRSLKNAAREREISDERDELLASPCLRAASGTGAALNVSAATASGQGTPTGTSHGFLLVSPYLVSVPPA